MTGRRGTAPRLKDTRAFRKMWVEGVSTPDIGDIVGLAHRTVADLARSFGYPKRSPAGALLGDMPTRPAVDEQSEMLPEAAPKTVQTDMRWSAEQDSLIIKASGRYADVAALAKTFDRNITAVLQRWHQLRVR